MRNSAEKLPKHQSGMRHYMRQSQSSAWKSDWHCSSLPSFARQLDLPQVAAAADATGQKMLSVAAKRAKALRDEMHRLLRLDMSFAQLLA
eukprot:g30623.t1